MYVLTEAEAAAAVAKLPPGASKVTPVQVKDAGDESKAKAALKKFFKTKLKATDQQVANFFKELEKMKPQEKAMILRQALSGAFWNAFWYSLFSGFMFLGWDIGASVMPSWIQKAYLKVRPHAGAAYVGMGALRGARKGFKQAQAARGRRQEKEEFMKWKKAKGGGTMKDYRAQQESVVDAAVEAIISGADADKVSRELLPSVPDKAFAIAKKEE